MLASGFWYAYNEKDNKVYLTNKRHTKSGDVIQDQTMIVPKDKFEELKKVKRKLHIRK